MKSERGVTFIEVTMASIILLVILSIIYSVFLSVDSTYRNEVPLRTAQLDLQKTLDTMAREVLESKQSAVGMTGYVWSAVVSGETLPVAANSGLVFLNARNNDGSYNSSQVGSQFVANWQRTITFLPLVDETGSVAIYRFDWGLNSAPPSPTTSTPVVTASSTTVTLNYTVLGVPIWGTALSVARTAGVKLVKGVELFGLQNPGSATAVHSSSGAGSTSTTTYSPNVWLMSATISVQGAKTRIRTQASTSIYGRAN